MPRVLLLLLLLTGCKPERRCTEPGQHDIEPARPANPPHVSLGAFTLGIDGARAEAICTDAGATWTGVSCVGAHTVQLTFDTAGQVHDLWLGGLAPEELEPLLAATAAAIEAQLGAPFDAHDGTYRWNDGGGDLTLARDAADPGAVRLWFFHDAMVEKVTYGLPTCG